MKKTKIRVAITGIDGRMGRNLLQAVIENKEILIGAALIHKKISLLGLDVGHFLGLNKIGVLISNSLKSVIHNFDILIDFTRPKGTLEYIKVCHQYNKKMVIGTTGFDELGKEIIYSASKKIGIVFSENFSIGINLILKLVEEVSKTIGYCSDIEILEEHHRYKVDAPSGTALLIGNTIANSMGLKLKDHAVYNRKGITGKRKTNEIGFSVIRAGDIVGKHTVYFSNIGECIKISHQSSNRMIFAYGALKAANWLKNQNNGIFNMNDVLFSYK